MPANLIANINNIMYQFPELIFQLNVASKYLRHLIANRLSQ